MEIYVIFGLPGSGKTFVGETMQRHFGFYAYDDDGDKDMPKELKDAIIKQKIVTDQMRDKFFDNLIKSVKKLKTKYKKIVIPQTFIKEKYRKLFFSQIPEAKFIFVQTDTNIRENRLMQRTKGFRLELRYWRKMSKIFEQPKVKHFTINNNHEGEENIKRQLQLLLK